MQYLAWRVLVGLNKTIILSFLLVGHTKFAPDWCFGLLKQRFRRSRVDCLDDIVQVIQSSAVVNEVQLVAKQNGEILVPTYDWAEFFQPHFSRTALKGIKSYQHFRFDAANPEIVYVSTVADGPEKKITLLSDSTWTPSPLELPPVIPPVGLSLERQTYLFEKIREFCRPEVRDEVCPRPAGYGIAERQTRVISPLSTDNEAESVPPSAKRRLCSICQQPGHNKRSCHRREQ